MSTFFNIITNEQACDINLSTDIVICTRENDTWFNISEDGTINIVPNETFNISNYIAIGKTNFIKNMIPIKMYIPTGIRPIFKTPDNQGYFRVFPYYKKSIGFEVDKDIMCDGNTINVYTQKPTYNVYSNVFLGITFDMSILRKENPRQIFDNEHPMSELMFINTVFGNNANNVIYCSDNDMYNLDLI